MSPNSEMRCSRNCKKMAQNRRKLKQNKRQGYFNRSTPKILSAFGASYHRQSGIKSAAHVSPKIKKKKKSDKGRGRRKRRKSRGRQRVGGILGHRHCTLLCLPLRHTHSLPLFARERKTRTDVKS